MSGFEIELRKNISTFSKIVYIIKYKFLLFYLCLFILYFDDHFCKQYVIKFTEYRTMNAGNVVSLLMIRFSFIPASTLKNK